MLKDNAAVVRLLAALTRGGKFRGNPYCSDEVKAVLRQIARERGYKDIDANWYDALSGLPEYENYQRVEVGHRNQRCTDSNCRDFNHPWCD